MKESPNPSKPDDTACQVPTRIGPNHIDLYLLIIGIACGLILGPWVLGRVAPENYEKLFVGSNGKLEEKAAMLRNQYLADISALSKIGITPEAIDEQTAGLERDMQQSIQPLLLEIAKAKQAHQAKLTGYGNALLLAVIVFMIGETLIDPEAHVRAAAMRNGLATARYALLAIWLALFIARFESIRSVPLMLLLLLVGVGIAAALVPMGAKRQTSS